MLQGAPAAADVERRRMLDVLAMHRLSRRTDGGAALLHWLAGRSGCWLGLLDRSGAALVESAGELDDLGRSLLARGLTEIVERGLPSFVLSEGRERRAVFLAVEGSSSSEAPILAMVGPDDVPASLPGDAALVLATCWSAEQTRQRAHRVERAEARCREAVLHLLMSRQMATACQVASTLTPALPDPTRVHVVESAPGDRQAVVDGCAKATGGAAWTVRCPVRSRHVIVLTPVASGHPAPGERECGPLELAISEMDGCTVGTGDVVALRDVAVGYEQAFHALAVARGRVPRRARFDATLDLPTVLGTAGLEWANALLAPALSHVPARASDPDAHELLATARSWLSFSNAATRHLKIHRNTLAARLRRLEDLLGIDLSRPGDQAALDLAIRIRATPRPVDVPDVHPGRGHELDDLLRLPASRQWAQTVLRPLRDSGRDATLETTLRVWLDCDARLSSAAQTLGLSVAGARKRVERLEALLRRSLLVAPSARHDLWLAVRALAT